MSNVVFSNVHLNFSFDSDSLFSRIETILYQWAKRDLSDVFDKVFEDRDVDDADLHLENVDFDLGDVPEGFFLSETCSRLKEKLEQLLYPKIENQRKTICLKILLNSCKKFAPEIEASQVEEIFSIVYRAEDSKETIFKNVISILQKNHPDLSFDEMTQDVLNELIFVKSKKDNIYLLNVLEKIYFSFFQEQEESFIQSFLTSTIPQHYSDGYLDLLKHFILEMQEKYPELSDIQNSKNLFFETLKDNNNADLKQIFSDICASVLPGNSSTFIDDFIARTKESVPAITTLGIVILFIEELEQKYPQLNDFRLSNFNEDKLSDLSKIYWKEDIKEILWDIYKSILQDEASHSENPTSEESKQNQESASVSEDVLDKAEEFNAEKSETAESDDASDNASESKTAESKTADSKVAESDISESDNLETKSSSDENKSEESTDIENPTSQESKQNQESTSISDDVQDKAENLNAEKSETAESDDSGNDTSDSNAAESKAAENEFSESDDLESKSSSNKNKLAESTDAEKPTSEDGKQNQESENVSDEVQDKAEEFNAEKSETAESDNSSNDDSESKTAESKTVESDFSESEDLETKSSSDENKPEESTDAEKPTSEEGKQNQENTSVSEDAQDKTENLKAEKSETAESDDASDDASESKTAESKAVESDFSESEDLETKSSSDENKPEESTDAEKPTSEEGKQNQENTSVSEDAQDKAEEFNAEKSETAESDDASDDASESKTAESKAAEYKATESEISENGANKQSQFKANTTQVQTSEAFDKIFNECIAENSSPEKNTSPLQVTESFISKLQKEFPDKAAPASAIKAYQKATELEMKYNSTVDDKNEIVVKDAGLVLIGAYVPMLFKKLEYIADGAFISEQTRLKACSLLRYIVFGDLPSDGLHFLGNYFCGLPWNFRIPKEIVLDENEKNIAESLIKSVIDNWKAIGHVSIDGFRGTFLHRDGKIEKEMDEEIHLKVKQGPFDMLLDKLPWSYSMLKFKWHKKLLTTTWR